MITENEIKKSLNELDRLEIRMSDRKAEVQHHTKDAREILEKILKTIKESKSEGVDIAFMKSPSTKMFTSGENNTYGK